MAGYQLPGNQIVLQQAIEPDNRQSPGWELPKTVSLEKGKKYYWKIRVNQAATGERGDGNWSKVMSFSLASPAEETSQPGPTPVTPSNGTAKETEPLPWIVKIPLWGWIAIAFLLVAIPIATFLASRAKK
jgi:hypothetical protein